MKEFIVDVGNYDKNHKIKENLFFFILKWIDFDKKEREKMFQNLHEILPLNELSLEFLSDFVSKNSMIRESFECSKILIDSFCLYFHRTIFGN